MNARYKILILISGFCVAFGLLIYMVSSRAADRNLAQTRRTLQQAVEKAKNGDRRNLETIILSLRKGGIIYVSEKLHSDYVSFLKDSDGMVQLLGAESLLALGSVASKNDLCDYVKGQEEYFTELTKMHDANMLQNLDRDQLLWRSAASSASIQALGEIGDKSAIAFLEALLARKDHRLNWDNGAIEKALAQTRSIKSLSDLPEGADSKKISAASIVISSITDPNKVPELMATVKSVGTAIEIRNAALSALASINAPGTADFLIIMMNDPNTSEPLRCMIALHAGRTKDEAAEKALDRWSEVEEPRVRAHAIVGLILLNPNEYMSAMFDKIMDPNEDVEFRERLVGVMMYVPRETLKEHKRELYECLNATDAAGQPVDMVRLRIWQNIDGLFRDRPVIILSNDKSKALGTIKSVIRREVTGQGPITVTERDKLLHEKLEQIVKFYSKESEVEK